MSKAAAHKRLTALLILAAVLLSWYLLCLPRELFPGTIYSTVVTDRNGELLGARIASDGQWRFGAGSYSDKDGRDKYFTSLIEFEDRWFRCHPGINPVSICKAMYANMKAGHVVSGGSTITMQVIRMSRQKPRTISQKFVEAILATRLELRCSKDEILSLYASHAPFGGNVVGLDAAAWRYFSHGADDLSWGEAATLAILPNSPSSIRPGKNHERLLAKRNRLLHKLLDRGLINIDDYETACSEPIPDAPKALPSFASHLVDDLSSGQYNGCGKFFSSVIDIDGKPAPSGKTSGRMVHTSIDIHLQRHIEGILSRRGDELSREGIADLAAVVIEVATGRVLAYCGNVSPDRKRAGVNVNAARSPRSSGSILKPFLYCDALEDGTILPYSLVADTPVNINGFAPQNYDMTYDGAVPAAAALSRSLNVPCVHILKDYGVQRFQENLASRGLTTLTRSSSDYGLSLILGGGECRLDEVTAAYAELAACVVNERASICDSDGSRPLLEDDPVAVAYTLDALKEVNRPDEIDWHLINSVRKVAWKTGTSYGYRDAWAVGVTPDYAVGVWAGNASGAGAAGLLGARTAGPVMFEIFNALPGSKSAWFPCVDEISGSELGSHKAWRTEVCHESGFLAGPYCDEKDTLTLPAGSMKSRICPYHHFEDGRSVFRLTPAMEWFYRQKHASYKVSSSRSGLLMEFIYPENGSVITLPKQLDGSPGSLVLNLAHSNQDATVYWHLDNSFIGTTRFIHQLRVRPDSGRHSVTVVDDSGNSLTISITIT